MHSGQTFSGRVSVHASRPGRPQNGRSPSRTCVQSPEFLCFYPSRIVCPLLASSAICVPRKRIQQVKCQKNESSVKTAIWRQQATAYVGLVYRGPTQIAMSRSCDDRLAVAFVRQIWAACSRCPLLECQMHGKSGSRAVRQVFGVSVAAVEFGDQPHDVKSQPEMWTAGGAGAGLPQRLE
jgi:hypothetical protein